jgi:hypothetical protein
MKEYPKEFHWFEGERILMRRLVNRQQRIMASLLSKTVITNKNLYTLEAKQKESLRYILGIVNSALISKLYLSLVSQATKDDFPQVTIKDILALPFRNIDFSNADEVSRHDKMVDLVERMLDLHKRLAGSKTPDDRTRLEREIKATDDEIDRLVYELYGLTEEEIKIVEESNGKK